MYAGLTTQSRGKVLTHLKSLTSDIMFLQETHLKSGSHGRLKANWLGEVYLSNFSSKARGVAIQLRKGVPFFTEKKQSLTKRATTI